MKTRQAGFIKRLRAFLYSIRFRLALWSAAVLALVLISFSVFIYAGLARAQHNATLNQLDLQSHRLVELSRFNPGPGFDPGGISMFPLTTNQGMGLLTEDEILLLVDDQGNVVQQVGPIANADAARLAVTANNLSLQGSASQYEMDANIQVTGGTAYSNYIFLVSPLQFRRDSTATLVLGRPEDQLGQLAVLRLILFGGSLGLILLSILGGYWLASRAMRPVHTITQAAQQISEGDLSRRINLKSEDELGELANTFDEMLARLQAAFDRQRQFTADASHELRTPLTIVGLEAGRALESRRPVPEYERTLRVIQSENEYMTRLVSNLLTLARMDAGQAALKMEPLDLSDVAVDAVERLAPLAARQGVKLETGDLPELPVEGDRQYLIQMVANLVENAIKYSKAEDACVQVSTGQRDLEAWLQVSDNGPGIAGEHLPHLFDRFYRVDTSRSKAGSEEDAAASETASTSSGLGLSIVQWIVTAHHGQVSVQSEPGKGSTFEVVLPLN